MYPEGVVCCMYMLWDRETIKRIQRVNGQAAKDDLYLFVQDACKVPATGEKHTSMGRDKANKAGKGCSSSPYLS